MAVAVADDDFEVDEFSQCLLSTKSLSHEDFEAAIAMHESLQEEEEEKKEQHKHEQVGISVVCRQWKQQLTAIYVSCERTTCTVKKKHIIMS